MDEQLVMERTGHRSIEGVRSYKRSSDQQREALSDILNRGQKTAQVDSPNLLSSSDGVVTLPSVPISAPPVPVPAPPAPVPAPPAPVPTPPVPVPAPPAPVPAPANSQVVNSAMQHRQQLQGVTFPSASFTGCNINFYLAGNK